jgi:UPF0716 protein FxsA
MLLRLFLLLTLAPLVELSVLVWIADKTNWQTAALLILVPGVLGAWMIRRAGVHCLRAIRSHLAAGELPADSLLDALFILVAGILLLTPGVLTDLAGLALLIPWTRNLVKRWLLARLRAKIAVWSGGARREDRIIDVKVVSDSEFGARKSDEENKR